MSDYTNFLDEKTHTLFAYQRLAEDATDDRLAQTEIVKKWWHSMKDLMVTNPDESPVIEALVEVFHMD